MYVFVVYCSDKEHLFTFRRCHRLKMAAASGREDGSSLKALVGRVVV